jgi:hypothetical protein
VVRAAHGGRHGAATTVRRAGRSPGVLSPAVLRFETRLARAACAAMAVFVAGAWLTVPLGAFGAGRAPGLFRPGAIDVAGLAVLTLALAVARQATIQARAGAR